MKFARAALIGFFSLLVTEQAVAADYAVQPRSVAASDIIDRGPNPYCGPRCGCPTVTVVRHRQLIQYLPSSFDPRTRDEPYYAYGRIRSYPRYGLACASETVRTLY